MPHVELSVFDNRRFSAGRAAATGEPADPSTVSLPEQRTGPVNLRRWEQAVTGATEPCLLLDGGAAIVALSPAGAELMGLGDPAGVRGRGLRDAGLRLVNFTDPPEELEHTEADKIPPLLALSSGQLARGLLRVAPRGSGRSCTMDAVATPLRDGGQLVGSLTFFCTV